nr:MAG TPA: Baseplate structural protein [Caudoviricetes sp.]DAY39221.1 MAG TPA: Baseplate structural protein [Caudoviricetes sp.]
MIYEKPKNEIFASDAKDGEIVEFPNIKRGWGVTENLGFIPPMEYFNAAFNRVDKSLAYQLQRGVSEWDKDLEYPIGAVVSLNGNIYIAKSQNTNKNPSENKEIWHVIASKEWSEQTFLNKDDKIDAYTKSESDNKFVAKEDIATETKAGITKLKNSITAQQEDAAVTEKAVKEFVNSNQKGLGVGQTYIDVKNIKQINENYENTTGKPIAVFVEVNPQTASYIQANVNDVVIAGAGTGTGGQYTNTAMTFIVPPGARYKLTNIYNSTIEKWFELR